MSTTTTSWGEAIRGLRLGAALERDRYSPGEATDLTLAIRNDGGHAVSLVESHLLWEYRFLVTLHGHGEVAASEKAQRILRNLESGYSGARRVVKILPDTLYTIEWKALLHEWFEIGRPGSYSVQAKRPDWNEGDAVLTSGSVRFEVT